MQEGLTPEKIDYSWIELAPILVVLVLVVFGLSVIPNCIDKENCVVYPTSPNIDIEKLSADLNESDNLFSMTNVEKP